MMLLRNVWLHENPNSIFSVRNHLKLCELNTFRYLNKENLKNFKTSKKLNECIINSYNWKQLHCDYPKTKQSEHQLSAFLGGKYWSTLIFHISFVVDFSISNWVEHNSWNIQMSDLAVTVTLTQFGYFKKYAFINIHLSFKKINKLNIHYPHFGVCWDSGNRELNLG